jgi:hypothetical protein
LTLSIMPIAAIDWRREVEVRAVILRHATVMRPAIKSRDERPSAESYRALAERARWMAEAATHPRTKDEFTSMAAAFDELACGLQPQ